MANHRVELQDMDELTIVLPDGQIVSIVYDTVEEQDPDRPNDLPYPELDINLPQEMTINAWPDRQGKNDPVVTEAVQIIIPVPPKS